MVTTGTIDLSLGCTAYGTSGKAFVVVGVAPKWVELEDDCGRRVTALRSAIVRWEPPTQASNKVVSVNLSQAISPTHKPTQQGVPLNPYREYPGSIATAVDQRLLEVFAATPEKWWTPAQLTKLPCMGGTSAKQVAKSLTLLLAQGLILFDGSAKYRGG